MDVSSIVLTIARVDCSPTRRFLVFLRVVVDRLVDGDLDGVRFDNWHGDVFLDRDRHGLLHGHGDVLLHGKRHLLLHWNSDSLHNLHRNGFQHWLSHRILLRNTNWHRMGHGNLVDLRNWHP